MKLIRHLTVVIGLFSSGFAFCQTDLRSQIVRWRQERDTLRTQAQGALDAETEREKAQECPNANTTLAEKQCLSEEIAKTQANYDVFATAIRGMLASPYPTSAGEQPVSGPQGTPLSSTELVAEFDRLETESKLYRKDAATAAFDQYKGGSLAPVFESEAELRLLRSHLKELAFVYGEELSNH